MELIAEFLPYFELFFLLLIGLAFTHTLVGQRMYIQTPNWDVINYALISSLPVYVVTSSLGLSLAEFATTMCIRFFVARSAMSEGAGLFTGMLFKAVWVALLFAGLIEVME